MNIESLRVLNGANVYSHNPVCVIHLDLEELKSIQSCELSEFNERLLSKFPNLQKHYCSSGKAGGFVEQLNSGTNLNHVLEHMTLELLALVGIDQRDKQACRSVGKTDDSKAVLETTTVETTQYLVPVAAECINAIVQKKSFSFDEKLIHAKEILADSELGPSTMSIIKAAEQRGIPWSRENDYNLVQLGYGKNLHLVQAAITDQTSSLAAETAGDKDETKQRLSKFSIPVPNGKIVRTEQEAVKAFYQLDASVVVKPLDGRQGKGVTINPSNSEEVIEAFKVARNYSSKVLLEELFEGKNYRVLVVDGKMVAASERIPCQVIGDGKHTIFELIEIENQSPLRGDGHEKPLTKIKINQLLFTFLEKENKKLGDIPLAEETVTLSGGINLSTGGTARDVTDEVHPTIKNLCERAARIINLNICGVDLVLKDISAPLPTEKGGIIELNAAPGLRMHCFPSEGKPRDVGSAIVEMLYPNGQNGRIPIFSITGTNGKTTVTRMISHILLQSGLTVGTTTTDGISINGEQIVTGDTTGPVSAKTILGDRSVEIAVLETARGGILRRGLGYDWSDISIITNISEDHIGQDGIESIDDLVNIKSLIAERVKTGGTLILNADDENTPKILERGKVRNREKKIVYFSMNEQNPIIQNHLENGGTAYFAEGDWITEAIGGQKQKLIEISSIPVTMNGNAEYQTANALAAISACRSYEVSAAIISGLKTFRNDADNPGRSNFYKVGKGYVLVDYGHNPGAFKAICRMAAGWHGKKVTAIIGVPGDRDDRILKEAGRIAAHGFHHIIIKEDKDTRGRISGEAAKLLCETVTKELPDRKCEIVLDEIQAFSKAVREIEENEIIVIFFDKLAPVLEIIEQYQGVPVSSFETLNDGQPQQNKEYVHTN